MDERELIRKELQSSNINGKAKRSNKNITIDKAKFKKFATAFGLSLVVGTALLTSIFSEEISLLKASMSLKGEMSKVYQSDSNVKEMVDDLERCPNNTYTSFVFGGILDPESWGVKECEDPTCLACDHNEREKKEIEFECSKHEDYKIAKDNYDALAMVTEEKTK